MECPEMVWTIGKKVMKMKCEEVHYPENGKQRWQAQGHKTI